MNRAIFISYSTGNKAVAEAVCAGLESRGIPCWIAPRDITAGKDWDEAITDAINASRAMVLIVSSHSNNSRQVIREVKHAANKNVAIVPFRIEDVKPTERLEYYLESTHWLDAFSPPLEGHIARLAKDLGKLLGLPDPPEQPKPAPQPGEANPDAAKAAARNGMAGGLSEALKKPGAAPDRNAASRSKVKLWVLLICGALACFAAAHWLLKTLRPAGKPAVEPAQQTPAERPEAAQIPAGQANPTTPVPKNPPAPAINMREEDAKKEAEEAKRKKSEEEARIKKISGCMSRGNKWLKAGKYKSAAAEFKAAVDLGAGDEAGKSLKHAEEKLAETEAKAKARAADTQNPGNASNCGGGCNWYDAVAYCKSRGSRLPTVNELKDMYQAECADGKRSDTCDKWYWSSEESSAGLARGVYFGNGAVLEDNKGLHNYSVRCR